MTGINMIYVVVTIVIISNLITARLAYLIGRKDERARLQALVDSGRLEIIEGAEYV